MCVLAFLCFVRASGNRYTAVTIARACQDYLPEGAILAEVGHSVVLCRVPPRRRRPTRLARRLTRHTSVQVVVAGGGTRNPLLMERLAHHVGQLSAHVRAPGCRVATHEQVTGVDNDCKEAMIFALLGYVMRAAGCKAAASDKGGGGASSDAAAACRAPAGVRRSMASRATCLLAQAHDASARSARYVLA